MEAKQQFHKRISCGDIEAKLETFYLIDEEDLKKVIRDESASAGASRAVEASQELERANEERLNLVQRRLKRNWIAKQGKHIQAFASATAKFLDSYQGIPKLLESSSAGHLVYGTLLIMISVGKNKQDQEDVIIDALRNIAEWLELLKTYTKAHEDVSSMQTSIVKVHECIIQFTRESAVYYSKSSMSRFWQTIRRPTVDVAGAAKATMDAISQVTHQGQAHMSLRVKELQDEVAQVSHKLAQVDHKLAQANQKLAKVHQDIQDNQQRSHGQDLGKSNQLASKMKIHLTETNPRLMLNLCRNVYPDQLFCQRPLQRGRKGNLQQISIKLLDSEDKYSSWINGSHSSLFLLSGNNYTEYATGRGLCWLSPVAIEVAESLPESIPLAFYSTQWKRHEGYGTTEEPFSTLLAAVTHQILNWNPHFFSAYYETVCSVYQASGDRNIPPKEHQELLVKLLTEWRATEGGPGFILIDRIDDVLADEGDSHAGAHIFYFIQDMLDAIQSPGRDLKILIIADSNGWRQEEHDFERYHYKPMKDNSKPRSFHCKLKWQQDARSRD